MMNTGSIYVWDCLERAMKSENPYGGDVAEVYAQHLVPEKQGVDPWRSAGRQLYALLNKFCKMHGVLVSVNGKPIGNWMNNYRLIHKCDVRIIDDRPHLRKSGNIRQRVSKQNERLSYKKSEGEPIRTKSSSASKVVVAKRDINPGAKNSVRTFLLPGQTSKVFGELEVRAHKRREQIKSGVRIWTSSKKPMRF